MKRILGIVIIAFFTSLLTFSIAKKYIYKDELFPGSSASLNLKPVAFKQESAVGGGYIDLQYAAEKSTPAVVHVNVETKARVVTGSQDMYDPFSFFFGPRQSYIPPQASSGSGVIISPDGYIVTNNHVVENADQVTVTLNDKKVLKAKVIAKDPSTDLAVLKVDERNLPYLNYGNSDNVRLGEWVLAVGYPLNLETTVTAGIISAKYRNLGINKNRNGQSSSIESFLQTDAAVNPGNSGGALVNANGELIGINTAIASPTGSYAGYSYAIPVNLVKKVVDDLVKFGNVQRGYLGIQYADSKTASAEQISAWGLDKIDGIYVQDVTKGGGAESAGIKSGDIITKLDGQTVKNSAQMLEQVGRKSPGDKVAVTYVRNGREGTANVTLKNQIGNTDIVKKDFKSLGASLKTLSSTEASKLRIKGGVQITALGSGALSEQTRIKNNFVITTINDENVNNVEELEKALANADGRVQLGGIYPGYQGFYYYSLILE